MAWFSLRMTGPVRDRRNEESLCNQIAASRAATPWATTVTIRSRTLSEANVSDTRSEKADMISYGVARSPYTIRLASRWARPDGFEGERHERGGDDRERGRRARRAEERTDADDHDRVDRGDEHRQRAEDDRLVDDDVDAVEPVLEHRDAGRDRDQDADGRHIALRPEHASAEALEHHEREDDRDRHRHRPRQPLDLLPLVPGRSATSEEQGVEDDESDEAHCAVADRLCRAADTPRSTSPAGFRRKM